MYKPKHRPTQTHTLTCMYMHVTHIHQLLYLLDTNIHAETITTSHPQPSVVPIPRTAQSLSPGTSQPTKTGHTV